MSKGKYKETKDALLAMRINPRLKKAMQMAASREACSLSFLLEKIMRDYLGSKGIDITKVR